MMLSTSWPGASAERSSAATASKVCGFTARITTSWAPLFSKAAGTLPNTAPPSASNTPARLGLGSTTSTLTFADAAMPPRTIASAILPPPTKHVRSAMFWSKGIRSSQTQTHETRDTRQLA